MWRSTQHTSWLRFRSPLVVQLTLVIIVITGTSSVSLAATPDEVTKAASAISETAKQLCAVVSDAGTTQSIKASGGVTAGLAGLFKKLGNIGVTVEASRDTSQYVGVLQADLAAALKDQNQCRKGVFDKIFDSLFPSVAAGTVQSPYVGYKPTEDFETELRYLLQVSGAQSKYEFDLAQVQSQWAKLDVALQKEYFPNNPEAVSDLVDYAKKATPSYEDIIAAIVPIYRKYVDIEALHELNALYSTPAMRVAMMNVPRIDQETNALKAKMASDMKNEVCIRMNEWLHRLNKKPLDLNSSMCR